MNKINIIRMCLNKDILSNFLKIHTKLSAASEYRIINMIKCGLNVIKYDRIVKHEQYYIINSFIPPLNSKAFLNIAMQVPGNNESFYHNHVSGKRLAPISCYVAITNKCMYNCWHCSASNQLQNDDLSTEKILYLIEQLKNLKVGIIGITGGEPLLRNDLTEIVSNIGADYTSLLFTTGFGLTYERALELKKSGLFGIGISIDSYLENEHDKLRGYAGAFEQALTAIKNAKRAGLYTMSQTVCTQELIHDNKLLELALLLKKYDVDEMRILEPLPCGKLESEEDAILSATNQERLKNLHIILNSDKKYPKASVFSYFESSEQFGCGAGIQHSYIDSSGNFAPCDFLDKRYGNVFEEDIHNLWLKMHNDVGQPKSMCLAKNPEQNNNNLPLFYRLMSGEKHE